MRDDLIKLIFNKAKKNRNIFLLTADLGYSLFDEFVKNLPNQFINVGICEQNMISLSAGLAKERKKVFVLLKTKSNSLQASSWKCNITRSEFKLNSAPSSGRKNTVKLTVLGHCYYLHE